MWRRHNWILIAEIGKGQCLPIEREAAPASGKEQAYFTFLAESTPTFLAGSTLTYHSTSHYRRPPLLKTTMILVSLREIQEIFVVSQWVGQEDKKKK